MQRKNQPQVGVISRVPDGDSLSFEVTRVEVSCRFGESRTLSWRDKMCYCCVLTG